MSSIPKSNHQFVIGDPPKVEIITDSGEIQQQGVPLLNPIVTLGHLSYNNQAQTPIKAEINSLIDKGFFLADNEWTCYRRNYFSCVCSYSISPPGHPNTAIQFLRAGEQQPYPVYGFAMCISAAVADNDHMPIELVQHTPKRDKGPVAKPEKVRLSPKPPQTSYYPFNSIYSNTGGDLVSSRGYDQGFGQTQSDLNNEHTFERVQFKQATANNGKSGASQQYYHLIVELWADTGTQGQDPFVKVAHRKSAKMIVRGRSLGDYPSNASMMPGAYAQTYDPRPYSGTRQQHDMSMEPIISPEDCKTITEPKSYQYYATTIYEGEQDPRNYQVELFSHGRNDHDNSRDNDHQSFSERAEPEATEDQNSEIQEQDDKQEVTNVIKSALQGSQEADIQKVYEQDASDHAEVPETQKSEFREGDEQRNSAHVNSGVPETKEPESTTCPEDDLHEILEISDGESFVTDGSSTSLTSSKDSGGSDDTSPTSIFLSIGRGAAVDLFANALSQERDLETLYQQARTQISQDRFLRNHRRLLGDFFQDLHDARNDAENYMSKQFQEATTFLKSRRQRERLSANIWRQSERIIPPVPASHPSTAAATNSEEKTPGLTRRAVVEDDVYMDPESSDSSEDVEEVDQPEEINHLLRLFTEGPAFEAFKSSFRSFLNPPRTVEEAVRTRNPALIQKFISCHFERIVAGNYPWLRELRDIGLTNEDIASILLNQAVDAPWVFFEPQDVDTRVLDTTKHIPGCVHNLQGSVTRDVGHPLESAHDQWHTERLIQELCGLAGVAPFSRDRGRWNGAVDFLGTEQSDSLDCQVSILSGDDEDLPISDQLSRITGALQRLCLALAHVQANGLCCNSFTTLYQADDGGPAIRMRRVPFSVIGSLFDILSSNLVSWETLAHRSTDMEALLRILSHIVGQRSISESLEHIDTNSALHYSALAVQTLCLGFLSYSQGHTGPLQPFFLDAPVQKVTLCGISAHLASRYGGLDARFNNLSCVGDMLGSPVLCISLIPPGNFPTARVLGPSVRHDLLANAEDMIDTWGPGSLVQMKDSSKIVGILLGGGIISVETSAENDTPLFHWSPYGQAVKDSSNPTTFRRDQCIRVASDVTENDTCTRDENYWLEKSSSCATFQDLGTHDTVWRQTERQLMGQGGQFMVFGAIVTWGRVQGRTLKQTRIGSADNELILSMDDPFGVQVSLCTGVSRRVTVRKMFADLMPVFAESAIDPRRITEWGTLRDDYNILNLFAANNGSIQDWYIRLPSESLRDHVITLIRQIFDVLQHTGFNPDTKDLNVAWPRKTDLRKCFRIPCKGDGAWLRFFADSCDSVTFAYITTDCFETGSIKCQASATPLPNAITVLETAVLCLYTPGPQVQVNTTHKLEHKVVYFFRKPGSHFYVRAEATLPAGPMRLILCSNTSPTKYQARVMELFHVKAKEPLCLRERRAIDSLLAEPVAVSARI